MKNVLKSLALVVPMVGLSAGALASAKKESWHCVDAEGKEVAGVKEKKACVAPNKWAKAAAPAAEQAAPAADHSAHPAPATEAPKK